ncbi:hypothetical protein ACIGGF_14875 [Rhodococcus sp. NPDC078407]|uniref:hypothetical protein n=1 Tax=Rhodococcus sp. NPDC078407 TaxID=3364509 RepID=UPI0037C8502C
MTPLPASLSQDSSIDEILDAYATGLLHFERFLPLVARVPGGEGFPEYEQVRARYEEQRGLNLGALGDDADAVEALCAVLRDHLEEHIQLRRVLQIRWHGEAGDAVQTYLSADQVAASEFLATVEDCHQSMSAAVDVLRDAVTDKAELFGALDIHAVEGRTVDEIDAILLASGIECVPIDRESVFPRLAPAFGDLAQQARGGDVSDEFAARVGERCRNWIRDQFLPSMKATCDAVLDACTATDTAVREILALMVDVVRSVHNPPFGDLDEDRWAITPSAAAAEPWAVSDCPPTTSPATSPAVASGSTAAAAIPAPIIAERNSDGPVAAGGIDSLGPRNTDDASGVRPGELSGLVDRVVAEIVERVDEALGGAVPDNAGAGDRSADDRSTDDRSTDDRSTDDRRTDDRSTYKDSADDDAGPSPAELPGGSAVQDDPAVPPSESVPSEQSEQSSPAVPPAAGATGERGHLEAELDGHSARIALEHDGAVTLRLDTPGLGTRLFELRIGPSGLPEIVETPGAAQSVDAPEPSMTASGPVLPAEPPPPPPPAPAEPAPPPTPVSAEPAPAPEPPPTEPTPSGESTDAIPDDAIPDDAQPPCVPESLVPESPVPESPVPESPVLESPVDESAARQSSDEEAAGHDPSAEQHPMSADRPGPGVEAPVSRSGAGLSEAGTL